MKAPLLRTVVLPIALSFALWPTAVAAQSAPGKDSRLLSQTLKPLIALRSGDGEPKQAEEQQVSGERGMTLDQLQEIALRNNPTLGQAEASVKAAQVLMRQAGLWPNPTVGYVGEEIRGGSFGGGQQGVFVQQDVILGGKLGLDRKIRAEEGKQAEAEAAEQKLRVETGVRIAFYESLAAQQMVEMRKKLTAHCAPRAGSPWTGALCRCAPPIRSI